MVQLSLSKKHQDLRKYLSNSNFKCKKTCYECCLNSSIGSNDIFDFTSNEEIELIKSFLKGKRYAKMGNDYCRFLTKQGKCFIYAERPLVCRIYGLIISSGIAQCKYLPNEADISYSKELIKYINNPKKI